MRKKQKRILINNLTFFQAGLLAGLAFVLFLGVVVSSFLKDIPDPANFDQKIVRQSTKIFDRTGTVLLFEVHGEERRTVIPFEEIPDVVKKATLAAEDINFYSHPAYDIRAIGRAVFNNIFRRRNGSLQGGSTITQQLVKNSFLTPERTVRRKLKELILAIRFEQRYSKDEIFGFYLNQIPYGSNAYGIESASQTFFAKPAKELSLEEASLLAGLPKAPSYYSPYGNHVDELKKRQEYILERMAVAELIGKEESENAKKGKLRFALRASSSIRAPHFTFYIKELLEEKYGPETVESAGLRVITSLDWRAQEIAEKAVREGALANDTNWKAGNAALIAQDAKTGQILALVGARGSFSDPPKPVGCEPGVNCTFEPYVNATMQLRQPGSAFKPLAYVTALKKGYTPSTVVFDAQTEFTANHPRCPLAVDFSNDDSMCYHPRNYDEKFRGPVTFRQALAQSLNVPAVKVLYLAGIDEVLQTAKEFGITTLTKPPTFYGLSLVLGGGGVKLAELVNAYSVFAQEGIFRKQSALMRVEDSRGKLLEETQIEQTRVLDAQLARLINDMLSDDAARFPAFQPNGMLTLPGRQAAAKTGTSQDYRDAWIVGYTPSIVAGVWIGNNDNRPMIKGGAGAMAAAPIWRAFMEEYLRGASSEDFVAPDPVQTAKPILRGEYVIDFGGGPQIHDILFWVDKNDPQGPIPQNPERDPQFIGWEAGAAKWLQENYSDWQRFNRSSGANARMQISLIEPSLILPVSGEGLRITAKVDSPRPVAEVAILFNQRLVIAFDRSPDNLYSVYFIPQNWQAQNEITIAARDEAGGAEKASFSVLWQGTPRAE